MKLDCVPRGSPEIRAKPPKRRPPLQYGEKVAQEAGKQRVEDAATSKAAAIGMTKEEGIKPSPRLPSRYAIVQYSQTAVGTPGVRTFGIHSAAPN